MRSKLATFAALVFLLSIVSFAQDNSDDTNTLLPLDSIPEVEVLGKDSELFSRFKPIPDSPLEQAGSTGPSESSGKVIAPDVQVLLSQFIPHIDEYLQHLILQLVDVRVSQSNNRTILDVEFDAPLGASEDTSFSFRVSVQDIQSAN